MEKALEHVVKPSKDEVGSEAETAEPMEELPEAAEEEPVEEKPRSTCMIYTPSEFSAAPWLGLVPPGVGAVALAVLLL